MSSSSIDTFAERLAIAMELKGIKTVSSLSRRTGIERSYLYRLANGDIRNPHKYIDALASATDVSSSWLYTGKGGPYEDELKPLIPRGTLIRTVTVIPLEGGSYDLEARIPDLLGSPWHKAWKPELYHFYSVPEMIEPGSVLINAWKSFPGIFTDIHNFFRNHLGRSIYKNIRKKSSTHRLGASPRRQLEKSTAYQSRNTLPTVHKIQLFDSCHSPALYHLSVNDINVKTDGNIELIEFQGMSEFETVTPTVTWPEQGPILLSQEQTMASVKAKANDWLYLPSLKPDETIIALRTKPVATCQIRKNRYTGLHRVNFSELPKKQKIKINFVVETKAQKTRPNRQYPMASGDTGAVTTKRSDATCSTAIKTALDKLFDRKNQADLPEDQQQQLKSMINPYSRPKHRISVISAYCQAFNGQSNPKPGENFFEFLIRSRQGSCAIAHWYLLPFVESAVGINSNSRVPF